MAKYFVTITEVTAAAKQAAAAIAARFNGSVKIYGVPRGGVAPAYAVAAHNSNFTCCDTAAEADCFIDDIYDSGSTAKKLEAQFPGKPLFVLFDKRTPQWADHWLVMPYEVTYGGEDKSIEDAQIRLQQFNAGNK